MALEGELIEDAAGLAAIEASWEALAELVGSPMSMPAWTSGWLRHLAPRAARLRAVVVRERGEVVGLAPMFLDAEGAGRMDLRLMGAPLPRLTPLAVPGREWEVAAAIGRVLAAGRPAADAVALEYHPVTSPWPAALVRTWPTKLAPLTIHQSIEPSPVVSLGAGSFDAWLATKSASFRTEMRRHRRRFEAAGGTVRSSTAETVREDVATFIRLHRQRWAGRGRSIIVERESERRAIFAEVGAAYVRDGRFRLILLEVDGEPVAAQLSAAAGGEVLALNSGWDEAHARLSPARLALLACVEDAFARGERRVDLAPGDQPYKVRIADGDDPVTWTVLLLPGARLPLSFARTQAPVLRRRLGRVARERLPDPWLRLGLRALGRRDG